MSNNYTANAATISTSNDKDFSITKAGVVIVLMLGFIASTVYILMQG